MDLNFIDGSTATVVSEQDIVGDVSFGMPLDKTMDAGASIKVLYSTLIGSKSALSFAGDIGLVYKDFMMSDLNLGISALNYGTGLAYLASTELLPFTIQGGASYNFTVADIKFVVAADGTYGVNDKVLGIKTGIEGRYQEFAVRVGVPISTVDDELAMVGVGYTLEDSYVFDYTVSLGKSLGLMHRVSVGIKFETEGRKSPSKKTNKGMRIIK
jgi:hypothetical protein